MKTAIILAAGRGERLKPFTNRTPKCLYPINQMPVIDYHLLALAKAGYENVIINHAYLGDQIRHHVGDGRAWQLNVQYSPEPPGALETGGGIYNIIQRFKLVEPFITINADIYTNYPLQSLIIPGHSLAHIVLVKNPPHNPRGDFGLTHDGVLSNAPPLLTVMGIIGYQPEAFQACQPGRYSVTPLIRELMKQKKATAEVFHGQWQDIGTMITSLTAC